ncbi:MAG: hypothetical protein IPO18_08555, partial [bacterium]|nr:hypothetical protein [bacterium]
LPERAWRADLDGLRPTLAVRATGRARSRNRAGQARMFTWSRPDRDWGIVARCLAVAEALRGGHDADTFFFTPDLPGPRAPLLDRNGFNHSTFMDEDALVRDISFLSSLSRRGGPAVCILDADTAVDGLARRLRADGHPSSSSTSPPRCGRPGHHSLVRVGATGGAR